MVVRSVCADRQGQPVTIHYAHDFHAFTALRGSHRSTPALRRSKRSVDETFRRIEAPLLAQRIGQILQDLAQYFVDANAESVDALFCSSGSTAAAYATGLPYSRSTTPPPARAPRVYRLAPRTPRRNVLLRKMPPYPFPLLFAQTHHNTSILPALSPLFNFEIYCSNIGE